MSVENQVVEWYWYWKFRDGRDSAQNASRFGGPSTYNTDTANKRIVDYEVNAYPFVLFQKISA